ncbi:MAG: AAA family ATPase [Pseudomonadota bacterium]
MYTRFFDLSRNPFSIAPNPSYLYLTRQHKEALAHLLYGIRRGGGFVCLTGEVGTGKTTLCHCLLEQLPKDVDVSLILNPRLNAIELLANVCDELRIPYPSGSESLKKLIDALNEYLLDAHARGRRTVLMIDEAQNLSFEVLEQIRLLTNLETRETKLLQIILVGQPELNLLLDRKDLRQLQQRITARYHLMPLSSAETAGYIRYRLSISGGNPDIFSHRAIRVIHKESGGIPRLINIICDRALLGAYAFNRKRVTGKTARKAAREIQSPLPAKRAGRFLLTASAAALLAVIAAGLYLRNSGRPLTDYLPTERLVGLFPLPEPSPPSAPTEPTAINQRPTPESDVDSTTATIATHTGLETSPPESAPPPETFEDLIQSSAHTFDTALGRLLQVWGINHAASENCKTVEQKGLQCLPLHGTWDELQLLNIPAVLEFSLPNGDSRHAALTALDDGTVTLNLDGQQFNFGLGEILAYWKGYFALLWKPPVADFVPLQPGRSSKVIPWIRQQLSEPGENANALDRPDLYDNALMAQVIEFQRSQGLKQDGIVGPQTLIHLYSAANAPGTPKLKSNGD